MRHYTKHLVTLALTAIIGILPARADVIINEENFPDENFRNLLLTDTHNSTIYPDYCNLNGYGADGVLTDVEIAKITHIYCYSKNIASLKGIEYFTALTQLWCAKNQLTELDVTQNTALKNLDCQDNQLTELDVTQNTALTKLVCDGNPLGELDVTQNTALQELWCQSNQLTELDVTQNTVLRILACASNSLTSLDVTKNIALTSLSCGNNQLTELDVTKNIALTYLYCGNNKLTELDVTQNTALQELRCYNNPLGELDVTKNTALKDLRCDHNQLTALDVTKNTALKYLDCYVNQLTALDVTKNTALQELYCYNNQLGELDVTKNTKLRAFYCGRNQLTALDVTQNTALTNLRCESNQLTELDVTQNTALKKLDCDSNQLTELDVTQNTALTTLCCDYNQLVELDLSNNSGIDIKSSTNDNFRANGQKRAIEAEVGWTGINGQKVKFYYWSLDASAGHGHEMQTLAQKLLVDDHADEWWSRVNKETMTRATLLTGSRNAATAGDIDPSTVYGSILVLTPTNETETSASGSMTYAYDMRYAGANTTVQQRTADNNFTLNWTADPQVITNVLHLGDDVEVPVSAVQFVNPAGQVSNTPWPGVNVVVKRHSDGTTATSKVIQ